MRDALARVLPREHGTWAMLLVPWAVGCGIAGRLTWAAVAVLLGALALFLAQGQLMIWYRRRSPSATAEAGRWLLLLGGAGILALLPVLPALPWRALAALALAAIALTVATLVLVARRLDHALPGQVLAALGLPLAAPAAYYSAGGASGRTAIGLWLVTTAFFLWAVFYVRLKIEARARRAPLGRVGARLGFAAETLVVNAGLAVLAVAALAAGGFPARGLLAFVPAAVQAAAGVWRLDRPAVLKRVGFLLLAHSIAFGILLLALL